MRMRGRARNRGRRVLAFGTAPWAPADEPSLVDDWPDAGQFYTNTTATTPVASDGDLIAGWKGTKAGNILSQATSGNRPVYRVAAQGGRDAAEFLAANTTCVQKAAFTGGSLSQPFTVAWVGKVTNATGWMISGGTDFRKDVYRDSGLWKFFADDAGSVSNSLLPADSSWHSFVWVVNGASSVLYVDGGAVKVGASGAQVMDGLTVGCLKDLSTGPMTGQIARVMLFAADLTAKVSTITGFLQARFATPSVYGSNIVVWEGDSITNGSYDGGVTVYPTTVHAALNPRQRLTNQSAGGSTVVTYGGSPFSDLTTRATADDEFLTLAGAGKRILSVLIGTNDIAVAGLTPAVVAANLKTYCQARQTAGWKVLLGTVTSRQGYDTDISTLNGLIRADSSYRDALADYAGDVRLGGTGASLNATYFEDQLHPTQAGQDIMAGIARTALTSLL